MKLKIVIPGNSNRDFFIPDRWRSRFAFDFGSRELAIPKRSPAELPGSHFFLKMKQAMPGDSK